MKRTSCFETHRLLWNLIDALPAHTDSKLPAGVLSGEALHYARVMLLLDRIETDESRMILQTLRRGLAIVPPEPKTAFDRDFLKELQGTWVVTGYSRNGSFYETTKNDFVTTYEFENDPAHREWPARRTNSAQCLGRSQAIRLVR